MALLIVSCVARQGLRCSQASNYRNPANDRQRTLQGPPGYPGSFGNGPWDPSQAAKPGAIPNLP